MAARQSWFWLLAIRLWTLLLGLSYTLRPIMLPALVVLPVLFGVLSVLTTREWHMAGGSLILFFVGLLPFLGQSIYRLQSVGDFNIVSFGGFGHFRHDGTDF